MWLEDQDSSLWRRQFLEPCKWCFTNSLSREMFQIWGYEYQYQNGSVMFIYFMVVPVSMQRRNATVCKRMQFSKVLWMLLYCPASHVIVKEINLLESTHSPIQ